LEDGEVLRGDVADEGGAEVCDNVDVDLHIGDHMGEVLAATSGCEVISIIVGDAYVKRLTGEIEFQAALVASFVLLEHDVDNEGEFPVGEPMLAMPTKECVSQA
jgi:hypothetical protein